MNELRSRHLFGIDITLHPTMELGVSPTGGRRIFPVAGGRFSGERLRGIISPYAGSDVLLVRSDGSREQDVRMVLITEDDAQILMTYTGRAHNSPEVGTRLSAGEAVDPSEYYLRTTPLFETASEKYAWLNSVVTIGVGERRPDGTVHYDVFEIL